MHAASQIPRPALVLGWLGVLPFAMFTLLAITGSIMPQALATHALVLYGVVILSFMAGAQWGLAMVSAQAAAIGPRLAISVLPALAAFGLWYLPATPALFGLAAVFLALLRYDIATSRAGMAPAWYAALRIQLTSAVVVCLMLAALLGSR
ncbi:MAG: DUF3429 domain-containing protein [Hyphomicrobiaceae bacterium]